MFIFLPSTAYDILCSIAFAWNWMKTSLLIRENITKSREGRITGCFFFFNSASCCVTRCAFAYSLDFIVHSDLVRIWPSFAKGCHIGLIPRKLIILFQAPLPSLSRASREGHRCSPPYELQGGSGPQYFYYRTYCLSFQNCLLWVLFSVLKRCHCFTPILHSFCVQGR